jgi:S1-C subfamily serine protease
MTIGTGFIVGNNQYVVTAFHVVEGVRAEMNDVSGLTAARSLMPLNE